MRSSILAKYENRARAGPTPPARGGHDTHTLSASTQYCLPSPGSNLYHVTKLIYITWPNYRHTVNTRPGLLADPSFSYHLLFNWQYVISSARRRSGRICVTFSAYFATTRIILCNICAPLLKHIFMSPEFSLSFFNIKSFPNLNCDKRAWTD
jgi:hypothetical protein